MRYLILKNREYAFKNIIFASKPWESTHVEPSWAEAGGQAAWQFLFGITSSGGSGAWWQALFSFQLRIVLGSIITMVIANSSTVRLSSVDHRHRQEPAAVEQGLRLQFYPIPVDSILFPLIAFSGIISATAMTEMFYTNITVKAIVTLLAFWTIYLVPEKLIYQ